MSILKKAISTFLSLVVVGGIAAVGIPLSANQVSAAEINSSQSAEEDSNVGDGSNTSGALNGNVTISYNPNSKYKYNPSRTMVAYQYNYQTENASGIAFCSEPIKGSPTGASTSKTFTQDKISQITKSITLNVLYYGYGGPGFETEVNAFSSGQNSGYSSTSKGVMGYYRNRYNIGKGLNDNTFYYAFTHLVVAYSLYGDSVLGSSGFSCNEWKGAVVDYLNLLNKELDTTKKLPDKQSSVRGYLVTTGTDSQNIVFAVYRMRLEFKKMSSSTFTANNPAYSLSGAQFTLFTDLNAAKNAVTKPQNSEERKAGAYKQSGNPSYIQTDSDGKGYFVNVGYGAKTNFESALDYAIVDIKDYYIVEHRVPPKGGYELNNTIYRFQDSGRVDSDGIPIFTCSGAYSAFVEHPKLVLQMQKRSGDTSITDGNDCYSLEGAQYGIYTDSACTKLYGTITTDKDGNGSYLNGKPIDPKDSSNVTFTELWAKEIKPSPGYLLDTEKHKLEFSGDYSVKDGVSYPVYSFESVEMPDSDPLTVILQKYDATTGKGTNTEKLANALFEVNFYPKQYASIEEIGNDEPLKSWIFKTDTNGRIHFYPAYKVSGSDFWYDEGQPTLPYGTITVKEVEAPAGYQLNEEIYLANINGNTTGKKISWRTTNVNEDETVLEFPETQDNGGLEIRKTSTDNKVSDIWFRVSAEGYSKDFKTDNSGLIVNDELSSLDVSKTYTVTELGYKVAENQYRYPLRYGTPPEPQTVRLETGKTTTVSFRNTVAPTRLEIRKESDDKKVSNIWFSVTASDGTQFPNICTDETGLATLNDIPVYDDSDNVIQYTVTELGEANGDGTYSISDRYLIPNPQRFNLTNDVTEENGITIKRIVITNVLCKAELRIIKQISKPDNTEYNYNEIWFNISSTAGYSVNVKLPRNGQLTQNGLDIYDSDGNVIEYTVTELGYKQADGSYLFPPQYLRKAPDKFTFDGLSTNHQMAVLVRVYTNKVKAAKLQVEKKAFYNDVNNVWFRLTSNNGYSKDIKTDSSGVVLTDSLPIYNEQGNIITYTLDELGYKIGNTYSLPVRYIKPDSQTFTFENYDDTDEYDEISLSRIDRKGYVIVNKSFDNTPKLGNLQIVKTSDDGVVSGFYFNVRTSSNDYGNYATGDDGTVVFPSLPIYDSNDELIEYIITELGFSNGTNYYMPNQYVLPNPATVTLRTDEASDSGNAAYTTVPYHNTAKPGKIRIVKTADDDIVADIYFKITDLSANQLIGIYKTTAARDTDGTAIGVILSGELPVYRNEQKIKYKIEELGEKQSNGSYVIPNRYVTPQPATIELTPNQTSSVSFTNTSQLGYAAVFKTRTVKIDGTGSPLSYPEDTYNSAYPYSRSYPHLSGAKIGLFSDSDCTNLIAETVTDNDGFAVFGPIPFGNYYAKETEGLEGYFTNYKTIVMVRVKLTAEEAKQTTSSMIGNAPASFYVFKVDENTFNASANLDDYDKTGNYLGIEESGQSGCEITVYDSHNEIVDRFTTTNEPHKVTGRSYGKTIKIGETYKIVETKAADGFSIAAPIQYTVNDAEAYTEYFENPRTGQVELNTYYRNPNNAVIINKPTETYISKTDITGDYELVGASLTLTDSDNTVIESWVSTDTPHLIYGLIAGQSYTLTETQPPNGYVTAESVKFTVNADGSVTRVSMKDNYTRIRIDKIDESGNRVAGVTLQILDENGDVIHQWVTDGINAHDITGELDVGKAYTLHEDAAPDNYTLAEDITFTVRNVDELQIVEMTNKLTNTYITKTDITGDNELEGAHIVLKDVSGAVIDEWTSGTTPHLITGLSKGKKYKLIETIAPNGYTISEAIDFMVNKDGTPTHVKMKDAPTRIKLEKVDEEGNRLSGVVLQVLDENNSVIDEWTSSADSDREITGRLNIGKTYRMHEVSTLPQYVLSNDAEFTVENTPEVQVVRMVNKQTETYISKTEITGSDEISGAHLKVTATDGTVVDEWVSENAPHLIKGLIKGCTYTLTETQAPNGYTIAESAEFTVNADGSPTHVVMRDDDTKVKITKVDEEGTRIANVTLQVLDESNQIVEEWTTDGTNDKLLTRRLAVGKTYTLHEVSAPLGYILAEDITFTVENVNTVQTIRMENKKTTTTVSKRKITGSSELPGATLVVKDSDDNEIDRWISGTTPHNIKGLEKGKTYTLTEITSPDGYIVAESVDFTVNSDGTITEVIMRDAPTRVRIIKQDADGNAVSGVTLQVLDADRNIVSKWTTGENGTKSFSTKFKVNTTYVLHEVSAPFQYQLADDVEFTVENTSEIQTIIMTNKPKTGSVTLNKQDQNGDPIDNSVWALYDSENNLIKTVDNGDGTYSYTDSETARPIDMTTVDGSLTVDKLPVGSYYFKELTPPDDSYFPYEGKVEFTISADDENTLNPVVTVKNNKNMTIKTGGTGNIVFYLVSGFSAIFAAAFIFIIKARKKDKS